MVAAKGWAPTHTAETGGQYPFATQITAKVLRPISAEGLVGTLDNALATDIDPGPGGHLAVHHQTLAIEFVEMLPVGPGGH